MSREIDAIVQMEREQDRLLEAAREAALALSKERRRQLLTWLIARVEQESRDDAVRGTHAKRRKAVRTSGITNRAAVTHVLGGGKALQTGDIVSAVKKIKPEAGYPSVVAEIARMRTDGLLEQRGKAPGNYELWGLTNKGGAKTNGP